jgi:PAS domain S-box-containing protein
MEAEKLRAKQSFNLILESAGEGIFGLDLAGNHTFVNPMAANLLGYKIEELIGKHSHIIWHHSRPNGDPYLGTECNIYKTLNEGTSHHGEEYFWRKDGSGFPVDFSTNPILDDGKVTGAVVAFRDITERKKAEEELRASEERFRSVTQSANNAIITTNSTGIVLGWNNGAEKIFGFTEAEIIRKSLEVIIPIDYRDNHKKGLMRLAAGNEPHIIGKTVELNGLHKNGNIFSLELSLGEGETSEDKYFTAIIRDITERKRSEAEQEKQREVLEKLNGLLKKSNSEKDKFFSIIAHDLRSPFSGFLGLTEMMANEDEDLSKVDYTKFSKSLHDSASNLYKLIENLLEWAQMQSGSINYNPCQLNLSEIVSHCIATIHHNAMQKGITVTNEVSVDEIAFADEKMIAAVLRNLLSNAVKFTRRDGEVVIRAHKAENEMVTVSVMDTGVGIAEKDVEKLFRMEEKVSSLGTAGEPSTGLGLLLCKEFIEMHGGKIWVESEKDKGSIFYFTVVAIQNHI